MDANELKRHSEFYKANAKRDCWDALNETDEFWERFHDAQNALCNAFLAEHDPTPLTLDIVRKYAETEHIEDDRSSWFEFEMELECYADEPFSQSAWLAGGVGLPECLHPTTVGELATLARLCGFSLKERT